ncbi:tetratricopeptide repeat protein [Plantactinospora solaniradicis]|uniref:Tetratricopeptide repeat protein n=1 Tax=Plantactinospora solaniradicis TaxID=1723736 RepID=A0ABW1KGB5_9ACTN
MDRGLTAVRYTCCSKINLANDLAVAGEYEEALRYTREALAGLTAIFGEEHPQVVVCRNNLSLDLENTGAPAEAHGLRQELEQQYRTVFRPNHPETQLMQRRLRGSIEIEPPNW